MRRVALVGLFTALPLALTGFAPGSAAPEATYTITSLTRMAVLNLNPPGAMKCSWKGAADLMVFARSKVSHPIWDGQVNVTGLKVSINSGSRHLATLPLSSAYLEPGAKNLGGSVLTVSCKRWRPMMKEGFGGPRQSYKLRIVGTGKATDTNDGSVAGKVVSTSGPFKVTVKQMGYLDGARATRSGNRVRVSVRLRTWTKTHGRYAWTATAGKRVRLLRAGGNFRFDAAGTTRTNRRGVATFTIPARARNSYLQFKVGGLSYNDEQAYELARTGKLTPLIYR